MKRGLVFSVLLGFFAVGVASEKVSAEGAKGDGDVKKEKGAPEKEGKAGVAKRDPASPESPDSVSPASPTPGNSDKKEKIIECWRKILKSKKEIDEKKKKAEGLLKKAKEDAKGDKKKEAAVAEKIAAYKHLHSFKEELFADVEKKKAEIHNNRETTELEGEDVLKRMKQMDGHFDKAIKEIASLSGEGKEDPKDAPKPKDTESKKSGEKKEDTAEGKEKDAPKPKDTGDKKDGEKKEDKEDLFGKAV
ncbi:MAG: uncharacterized protein A8A55_0314 [Amphiamblys sp. WSBS2006]|nr:MAG: uncharacterized protein A8A55_0314 [Amphiamblys sp. WSBS2006]